MEEKNKYIGENILYSPEAKLLRGVTYFDYELNKDMPKKEYNLETMEYEISKEYLEYIKNALMKEDVNYQAKIGTFHQPISVSECLGFGKHFESYLSIEDIVRKEDWKVLTPSSKVRIEKASDFLKSTYRKGVTLEESLAFYLGKHARIYHFAWDILISALQGGLSVAPILNIRTWLDMHHQISYNVLKETYLDVDVCVLLVPTAARKEDIDIVKDILLERDMLGKSTVVLLGSMKLKAFMNTTIFNLDNTLVDKAECVPILASYNEITEDAVKSYWMLVEEKSNTFIKKVSPKGWDMNTKKEWLFERFEVLKMKDNFKQQYGEVSNKSLNTFMELEVKKQEIPDLDKTTAISGRGKKVGFF